MNTPADPIQVLAEDLVLVDWGPMTLTIAAWHQGRAQPVIAAKAAHTALNTLRTLADFQGYLKRPVNTLPQRRPLPSVVKRAVEAVAVISPPMTGLAAVAGAAADEVAAHALEMGADKVIVNNGGDIALRLKEGQQAIVGLGAKGSPNLLGRLNLSGGDGVGGVASSGWTGRSHSPGVADLVTVWACRAGLADAAATHIAAQTTLRATAVQQIAAHILDPASDLNTMPVTRSVAPLSTRQRRLALARGTAAARQLHQNGKIRGCFIRLQKDLVTLDPDHHLALADSS